MDTTLRGALEELFGQAPATQEEAPDDPGEGPGHADGMEVGGEHAGHRVDHEAEHEHRRLRRVGQDRDAPEHGEPRHATPIPHVAGQQGLGGGHVRCVDHREDHQRVSRNGG